MATGEICLHFTHSRALMCSELDCRQGNSGYYLIAVQAGDGDGSSMLRPMTPQELQLQAQTC